MKLTGETKLFLFLTLAAIILGGLAFVPMLMHPTIIAGPQPDPTLNRSILVPPGSHVMGDPNAPFALVEFSDIQCPHCKDAEPVVERQLKLHPKYLCLVAHHYQASLSHEHSELLGKAAEAAGNQGKFFEMRDALFKQQDRLMGAKQKDAQKIVEDAAWNLGLDRARFRADLKSVVLKQRVEQDQALGVKAHVRGTPAFYFIDPKGLVMRFATTTEMTDWLNDARHWR